MVVGEAGGESFDGLSEPVLPLKHVGAEGEVMAVFFDRRYDDKNRGPILGETGNLAPGHVECGVRVGHKRGRSGPRISEAQILLILQQSCPR